MFFRPARVGVGVVSGNPAMRKARLTAYSSPTLISKHVRQFLDFNILGSPCPDTVIMGVGL
jgi:hypothetical protein